MLITAVNKNVYGEVIAHNIEKSSFIICCVQVLNHLPQAYIFRTFLGDKNTVQTYGFT